jgi:hypothetical protein
MNQKPRSTIDDTRCAPPYLLAPPVDHCGGRMLVDLVRLHLDGEDLVAVGGEDDEVPELMLSPLDAYRVGRRMIATAIAAMGEMTALDL